MEEIWRDIKRIRKQISDNGDKNELYLDVYKKEENECIKLEEEEN